MTALRTMNWSKLYLYSTWTGVEAPMYVDIHVDCRSGGIGRGSTVVGKFDFAKNLNYVFSNTLTLGFPDILKLIIRYLSFTCKHQ